jgi:hypothetical protein
MFKKNISIKWLVFKNGIEKFVVKNFSIFVPSSAGNYKILGCHTIVGINSIFPLLALVLRALKINLKVTEVKKFKNKFTS